MPVRLMILGALLILQKRIFFLGTFLFRKDFPFSCKGPDSLFAAYPLCHGFFSIFGNPISFSHPAEMNDSDVYKDSQYLLTGLNPTPALIPS